jgi:diadenylate cyclase
MPSSATDYHSADPISFAAISLSGFLDILIVAYLIFIVINLIRAYDPAAFSGKMLLLSLMVVTTGLLRLLAPEAHIPRAAEAGLLVSVIIFQPEIHRLMTKIRTSRPGGAYAGDTEKDQDEIISQIILACGEMQRQKIGGLLVLLRADRGDSIVSGGTLIDASVSSRILTTIFTPNTPLHDGAVIIKNGRVSWAGCILPLSENIKLSRDLGMRHRAGIGMSEETDAAVVILSEERGSISLAIGGELRANLELNQLRGLLKKELPGSYRQR